MNIGNDKWNTAAIVFAWVYRFLLVFLIIYQIHNSVPFVRSLLNFLLVLFVAVVIMFVGILMNVFRKEEE